MTWQPTKEVIHGCGESTVLVKPHEQRDLLQLEVAISRVIGHLHADTTPSLTKDCKAAYEVVRGIRQRAQQFWTIRYSAAVLFIILAVRSGVVFGNDNALKLGCLVGLVLLVRY